MIRSFLAQASAWIGAVALSAALLASPLSAQTAPDLIRDYAGSAAPSLPFTDRQGRTHTLDEFRGKIVIVNLWASWCVPCRVEMPALERVARAHPSDVVVVAIAQDRDGWAAVDRFWAGRSTPIRNFLAPNDRIAAHYGAIGLPYSVLLDRQGREVGRIPRAAEWDRGRYYSAVKAAIAKGKGK